MQIFLLDSFSCCFLSFDQFTHHLSSYPCIYMIFSKKRWGLNNFSLLLISFFSIYNNNDYAFEILTT